MAVLHLDSTMHVLILRAGGLDNLVYFKYYHCLQ